MAGLSAALRCEELGLTPRVAERENRPGGLCRTAWFDGFGFDYAIHILYSKDDQARHLIADDWLADNLEESTRRSFCYSAGVFTEYPYQHYNFGLPPEIIEENVLGLIQAHQQTDQSAPAHFEAWIRRTFGDGIARNFMLPYNRKVWAWDLSTMHYAWIADRVPTPTVQDVLRGALRPPSERVGPNGTFWYPREGGIEALPRAMAARLSRSILCESRVTAIDTDPLTVHWRYQRESFSWQCDRVISTLPISVVTHLMKEVPPEVEEAAERLCCNTVHTVCLGFHDYEPPDYHWVYLPEQSCTAHRVSFPSRFASSLAPARAGSLMAEVSESPYRPIDRRHLVEQVLAELQDIGLAPRHREPAVARVLTVQPAYVIYNHEHRERVDVVLTWLREQGIHSVGRFGQWEYFNMDHSILAGRHAAEAVVEALTDATPPL